MYIGAVHIQVLRKSKTVCFTSRSKGTYVFLPFEQKLWSSFPAEGDFSTLLTPTLSAPSSPGNHKRRWQRVPACLGRSGSVDHLKKLWTDHKGTEQNCEADGRGRKAILVWGEISHFSSTSRGCCWTDKWNPVPLEKGRVCHWGRRTVRTPSAENLRRWGKRMKESRSVDSPAGFSLRSKISRGKRECI